MKMQLTPKGLDLLFEFIGYLAFLLLIGIGVGGTLLVQYIMGLLAGWGMM